MSLVRNLECKFSSIEEKIVDRKILSISSGIDNFERETAQANRTGQSMRFNCGSYKINVGNCTTTWNVSFDYSEQIWDYGDYEEEEYRLDPTIECHKEGTNDLIVDADMFLVNCNQIKCDGIKLANRRKISCSRSYYGREGWWHNEDVWNFAGIRARLDRRGSLNFSLDLVINAVAEKSEFNSFNVPAKKMKLENDVLGDRMSNMLLNAGADPYSDVNVVCSDGTIPCHASILSAGSSYFKDILSREKTGEIQLKGIKRYRCYTLLEFIYTNKVDPAKIDLQLLQQSVAYGVLNLQQHCSFYLARNLDPDNCLDILLMADKVSDVVLKLAAKSYILSNMNG